MGMTLREDNQLNDPLGLTRAPDGHLIVANGGNGNLVEVTPKGQQIATKAVDTGAVHRRAGVTCLESWRFRAKSILWTTERTQWMR
jgi:hypothetical protein